MIIVVYASPKLRSRPQLLVGQAVSVTSNKAVEQFIEHARIMDALLGTSVTSLSAANQNQGI